MRSVCWLSPRRARRRGRDIKIGETFSLRSRVLGEERPYWVCLPASYGDPTFAPRRYPVLHLLDGEVYFHPASGVVQFMSSGFSGNNQTPESMAFAVPDTYRTRDLVPKRSTVVVAGEI